ncbi:MAG: outer membrane beta-barrel protein [Crocinitomicaceae bacterium]|nr:outer membrane beta-barrel protein [Crocinitomicaceae bacterium]
MSGSILFGQSYESKFWKRYRHEFRFGIGPATFLGDLGGQIGDGKHFIEDFDIQATRFMFQGGYKYIVHPYFSVRGEITMGMLYGDDKNTKNPIRQNRNLNFRTFLFEFAAMGEFYPLKERVSHLYRISGVNSKKKKVIVNPYIFGGIALIAFNPKGELNGQWYALQPLATEGQELAGRPKKYSRINVAFPLGIGVKFGIDNNWSVGIELSGRYTLSDYMDDVSTSYYDAAEIAAASGPEAAQLQDKALDPSKGWTGVINYSDGRRNFLQRGDPNYKDGYLFAIINVHYRLSNFKKRYIPKF